METEAEVVGEVVLVYTICGSDISFVANTIEGNLTTLTEGNYYGDCNSLEPIEVVPECPEDAVFECFEIVTSYGILDNSLWVGAGNHLSNADNNGIDLVHEDGSITSLPTLAAPYFNNFKTQLELALPDCKVVYVCANHSSPKGCNAGHVANLAQYPAYDAPTAPGDVQNNLANPPLSELWATGWLIECSSCESPIVRAEIRESNDAAIVGAYKDINVYSKSEKVYQSVNCDGFFYKDCETEEDITIEYKPCCLEPCGSVAEMQIEMPIDSCTTSTVTGCIDGKSVLLVIETCLQDTTGLNCDALQENIILSADDFEGTVGISQMIPGWEQLVAADNKTNATTDIRATSDVANATGPSGAGILGVSACGDTHVQSLIGGQGASVFGEGLKRNFTGLTVGAQYCVDFSQAVSNQSNGCFSSGGWSMCIDDDLATAQNSAETIDTNQEANPTNPNLNWESRQICFTATAASHYISFIPYTTDTDYTCNSWLGRMAIDCIQVTESIGGANSDDCSCTQITCISDPATGENYAIEDVSLVPCGTNDVCYDVEQSSDFVCINTGTDDVYAFAIIEQISDCNTGQEIAQNNYFTDLVGNTYNAGDVTFSEDCEGEIIEGQVCVGGVTLNVLTIDGVTTYYDLGGNEVGAPKAIDYVGACIEPISIIKSCAEVNGNPTTGLLYIGEGGNYFTDFEGNIIAEANPFCCTDCIQVFGCRDGRLAMPAGSEVVMTNGDVLDISGLRYTQIAQLITDTYGGTYEAPSLGGPQGANFSQCQGSSQHELQFYNLPISIVSITDWTSYGKFGECEETPIDYECKTEEFCFTTLKGNKVNGILVIKLENGVEVDRYAEDVLGTRYELTDITF